MQTILQSNSRKQSHNFLQRSSDNPSVCGIFFNMENIDKSIKKNGQPRKRYYLDLTGNMYGELEVIGRNGMRGKNILWECYCHACTGYKRCCASQLRPYTKSCGCKRTLREWTSPYWKGVGEISRMILTNIKSGAKKRKKEYDVTDEYLWELFLKQERKCALTGVPLRFGRSNRVNITASLDRIESDKGYLVGNVQWIHKHINAMKNNHTEENFYHLCKSVVEFNKHLYEK